MIYTLCILGGLVIGGAVAWLIMADPSPRKRSYKITAIYRQYIGRLSAMPDRK